MIPSSLALALSSMLLKKMSTVNGTVQSGTGDATHDEVKTVVKTAV